MLEGLKQCCDEKAAKEDPTHYRRMSNPEGRRKLPSRAARQAILESQGYRCLYCQRLLNSWATRKGKPCYLRLEWDHAVPFSYQQNNTVENFAAACHLCNQKKAAFLFATIEEIRVYVETEDISDD